VTAAGSRPFPPARRPGGRPAAKPRYRVLVHRKFADLWASLPERVGLAAAQQFYDHVAKTPDQPAATTPRDHKPAPVNGPKRRQRADRLEDVARLDRPRAAAPGPAEATGAHDARNTPHPGSTVTKPATLSSSTARRAVLTLTSYSVAIARTLGSCSPGNHSPASMRSRRAALTAR
jgi:hypothetical protein